MPGSGARRKSAGTAPIARSATRKRARASRSRTGRPAAQALARMVRAAARASVAATRTARAEPPAWPTAVAQWSAGRRKTARQMFASVGLPAWMGRCAAFSAIPDPHRAKRGLNAAVLSIASKASIASRPVVPATRPGVSRSVQSSRISVRRFVRRTEMRVGARRRQHSSSGHCSSDFRDETATNEAAGCNCVPSGTDPMIFQEAVAVPHDVHPGPSQHATHCRTRRSRSSWWLRSRMPCGSRG